MDWIFLLSTIFMSLAGILVYIYYQRQGEFDDPEEVKYEMFRDKE